MKSTATETATSAQGEVKCVSSFLVFHHCVVSSAPQQELVPFHTWLFQTTVTELWMGVRHTYMKKKTCLILPATTAAMLSLLHFVRDWGDGVPSLFSWPKPDGIALFCRNSCSCNQKGAETANSLSLWQWRKWGTASCKAVFILMVGLLFCWHPWEPPLFSMAALASRGPEQALPSFVCSKCNTSFCLAIPKKDSERVSVMVWLGFQI